jgi:hypothetical protein
VQGARQRWIANDRHIMLFGQASDLGGDQVLALGDHLRRRARAVVAQRHREMGRVGDDHVGAGDRGHHAHTRGLLLAAPERRLDLGRDPVLTRLVLDLLLGHFQLLLIAAAPPGVVDQADQQIGEGGALGDRHRAVPQKLAQRARGDADLGRQQVQTGQDRQCGHGPHDGDLAECLQRLENGVGADEIAQALGGIESAEVRLERLRGGPDAHLCGPAEHGREHAGRGDRHECDEHRGERRVHQPVQPGGGDDLLRP